MFRADYVAGEFGYPSVFLVAAIAAAAAALLSVSLYLRQTRSRRPLARRGALDAG